MAANRTTQEFTGTGVGHPRSNPGSNVRVQGRRDDGYIDGIHDLVREEEQRRRSGVTLQTNVTGMLQELDDIKALQASHHTSSSSRTADTPNQRVHSGCRAGHRHGLMDSTGKVDSQARNDSYIPLKHAVSWAEVASLQDWCSEAPDRMPWFLLTLHGDHSTDHPRRVSGRSEGCGTAQMQGETRVHAEENKMGVHDDWSVEGAERTPSIDEKSTRVKAMAPAPGCYAVE